MDELQKRIEQIHLDCHKLCIMSIRKYLPVAGNLGVFSQSEDEYLIFSKLQKELVEVSANPKQKYFKLISPIIISTIDENPQAIYTHLYIRKFDPSPYGTYLGDVDFVMRRDAYIKLRESVSRGFIPGAEIYKRPGWDTIQITDPNINSVAYISTRNFAEKVRVKFD